MEIAKHIENKLEVKNQPALLEVNFEVLKAALEEDLKKYKLVVTNETIQPAKTAMAELNKLKEKLDEVRKAEMKKASVNIDEFDSNMRELVIIAMADREAIKKQVDKFESETKEIIKGLLVDYRLECWNAEKVREEFKSVEIEDLVKLTAATNGKKGWSLSRATRQRIESRVDANKKVQNQTDMRIAQLEADSYKAGLKSPLTREHVEAFLMAEDDVYAQRLNDLMTSEIKRQEATEAALRADIEKQEAEKQRTIEQLNERAESPYVAPEAQEEAKEAVRQVEQMEIKQPVPKQPELPKSGMCEYEVNIVLRGEIDVRITEAQMDEAIRKKMKEAGVNNLAGVYVKKFAKREAA